MTETPLVQAIRAGVFDYPDLFSLIFPPHEVELWTPDSIRTFSGLYMDVFKPTPSMICLEDTAHSLSRQCRFGGHLWVFYSVAQHAVMCSLFVEDPDDAYDALHHDDSEAYLLDIPTPIKRKLEGYKGIESGLMEVLASPEVYDFNWPLSNGVKRVDAAMLKFEWDTLVHKRPLPTWMDKEFRPWTAEEAKDMYIQRHYELLELRKNG